ncbi:hypothetical protein MHYP_G00137480 [Metynnis hypsauchen]
MDLAAARAATSWTRRGRESREEASTVVTHECAMQGKLQAPQFLLISWEWEKTWCKANRHVCVSVIL